MLRRLLRPVTVLSITWGTTEITGAVCRTTLRIWDECYTWSAVMVQLPEIIKLTENLFAALKDKMSPGDCLGIQFSNSSSKVLKMIFIYRGAGPCFGIAVRKSTPST